MAPDPASKVRDIAVTYTLDEIYPDHSECDVIGMEPCKGGIRVGVRVMEGGLFSDEKFASLTVDSNGDVVLANKCNKEELYRRLGRQSPREQREEQIEETRERLQQMQEVGGMLNRFLFGSSSEKDTTSPPAKCPNCGTSRASYVFQLWKEVDDGEYNCRSCGHTVRIGADASIYHDFDL